MPNPGLQGGTTNTNGAMGGMATAMIGAGAGIMSGAAGTAITTITTDPSQHGWVCLPSRVPKRQKAIHPRLGGSGAE